MSPALVHIHPDHGPVGVWRHDADHLLEGWYPPEHQPHAATAMRLLDTRGYAVTTAAWFAYLAERHSYTATFDLTTADDAEPLSDVYTRARAAWVDGCSRAGLHNCAGEWSNHDRT